MNRLIVTVTSTEPRQSETYLNPLAVLVIDANGDGTTAVSDTFSDARMIAALLQLAERMSITLGSTT